MKASFIFPGQGSQIVGMGKIWYEKYPKAREIFDNVDEILKEPLSKIIFDGPDNLLTKTENAQPAILTTSIAILEVIKEQKKIHIPEFCHATAGHSLGEYTALYASGSIDLETVVKLVKYRGELMSKSDKSGEGKMTAIIGLDIDRIKEIINNFKHEEVCELGNDNCKGQVVISGNKNAVEEFKIIVKKEGAKLIKDLNVSAPFHCALMGEASDKIKEKLGNISFSKPTPLIYFNVTGRPVNNEKDIPDLLSKQIISTVRWRETILSLDQNSSRFFEIGPGNVLTGLVKRTIDKNDDKCFSIQFPEDMDNLNY